MSFLDWLARVQHKHSVAIISVAVLITILLGAGIFSLSMQSDMDKMMPQDLEIYRLQDQVSDHFGNQDGSFILVRVEGDEHGAVYDIRDPEVLEFLVELESELSEEQSIVSVSSIGSVFTEDSVPKTLSESKAFFDMVPQMSQLFNNDYSATMVLISADLGGEDKIQEFNLLIEETLESISKPDGVEVYVTGTPQIRSIILDLLVSDAIFTLSLSGLIILVFLIIMQRSFTKAFLIFTPLVLGLVWTLGLMGWIGIELSMATVGIGAMILGLGVEYGVFILERYTEERKSLSSVAALEVAVREVGGSVLGSGTTTVMGFLALTLSVMPMLRDLGLSLAIGIAFSLVAAVFVNPALIVSEERFEHWSTERSHRKATLKKEKHKGRRKLDEKSN